MNTDKKIMVTHRVGNMSDIFGPPLEVTEICRQSSDGSVYSAYEDRLEKDGMYIDYEGTSSYCQSHGHVTNFIVRQKANGEYVEDYCPHCNSGNWTVSEEDIVSISEVVE